MQLKNNFPLMNFDFRNRKSFSVFFLKSTYTTAIATFGLLLLSTVSAQIVVIDDFTEANIVAADDANPLVRQSVTAPTASIIGGRRDVMVDDWSGVPPGEVRSVAGSRRLLHAEDDGVQGRTTVVWDGVGSDGTVTINPTGLGGDDLTRTCPGISDDMIAMIIRPDNGNDFSITFDVFTDGSNWSNQTIVFPADPNIANQVAEFRFTDFVTQAGSGASFDNVGAIRMVIETNLTPGAESSDVSIRSAISTCGFDFGDAPDGRTGFGGPFYPTVLDSEGLVPSIRFPGAHHRIGGPWMPATGSSSNDTDSESNGQPSTGAVADDGNGVDDENGVDLADFSALIADANNVVEPVVCDGFEVGPSQYCAAVRVANPTTESATLVGWVDFDGLGAFGNSCSDQSGEVVSATPGDPFGGCDRSAAALALGDTGLSTLDGTATACNGSASFISDGSFSTGNIPPNCIGTVVMMWELNTADTVTAGVTYSRFRISTDSLLKSANPVPHTLALDGEVEDHELEAGTVPVSIHSFESKAVLGGVEVVWETVSENENVGFFIWGDNGRDFELLTPEMIPSQITDIMGSRSYRVLISERQLGNIKDLIITAVDERGNEEMYGMFSTGVAYGRESAASPIEWAGIREATASRLAARGFERSESVWQAPVAGNITSVDFRVSKEGMQRVTYQDLLAAGLDLAGVDPSQIAVTVDGRPVARRVHRFDSGGLSPIRARKENFSSRGSFGSNHVIDFWGDKPDFPDALYVSDYNYRISVDAQSAIDVGKYIGSWVNQEASFYWETVTVNEDNHYAAGSVLTDPWYAKRLRANHSDSSYATTVNIPNSLIPGRPAKIAVQVAGVTDFPQSPDHHVEVLVNGDVVEAVMFDGRIQQTITAELPAGTLVVGSNAFEVRLPGGTEAPADLVYLDLIEVTYASSLLADSDQLLISEIDPNRAFTVQGLREHNSVAYAWDGELLIEIPTTVAGRGMVGVAPARGEGYRYWVSGESALHRPAYAGVAGQNNLLNEAGNFLIVAHPAFVPSSSWEAHPLNDFINHRNAEGWNVRLLDIAEIQRQYSGGMPLPSALTRFLQAADQSFSYEHVLLVGSDSYDYQDRLGLGSISFIPTRYAPTKYASHTPSDALLSDLNGDGLSDKALGRWPVRSLGDLQSIVAKTLDWDANMAGNRSAVWIADTEDPSLPSFRSQVERMMNPLATAGWLEADLTTIEMGPGHFESADAARSEFFALLEQGRTLSGFAGHGSAGMWTQQGLLVPDDIQDLSNQGFPTLVSTMACYTSYFVSPHNDTIAHRLMNGYKTDGAGNQIAGAANGAAAVHGAATLSSYAQNEIFAREVLQYQLEGRSIGQAVQLARARAAERRINDLVVNWTLLGDPTLTLQSTNTRSK